MNDLQKAGILLLLVQPSVFVFRASCAEASLAQYCAQGELTWQNFGSDQKVQFEQHWVFSLAVDVLHRWKLNLDTRYPDPAIPVASSETISYDGQDIYSITYSDDLLDTSLGKVTIMHVPRSSTNCYPARVCSGPYPVDHSSAVGVLWLAFVAGMDLDPKQDTARVPNLTVACARTDPMAWICDLHYRLMEKSNTKLLTFGSFVVNSNYFLKSGLDYPQLDDPVNEAELTTVTEQVKQYAALKGDTAVRAVYQLDESQSINNTSLPKRFHCEVAPPPNRPDLRGGRFRGVVTNYLASVEWNPMPDLFGRVVVEDRRLRTKEAHQWRKEVYYALPNDKWITDTNDPRIIQAISKAPMRPRADSAHYARMRAGFLTAVVLWILWIPLPVLLLFLWFRRRRRRGTETISLL